MSLSEASPYEDDDATHAGDSGRPDAVAERASALLEAVAHGREWSVHRLDREVLVAYGLAFRGLTGPATGKVAEVLCGNDAWLRDFLADRDFPVVPTRVVDLGDGEHAWREAEALGLPVGVRLASGGDGEVAEDLASFHELWRAVVAAAPDRRAKVILERRPAGRPFEVAVVAGQVVTQEPSDTPPEVGELAVRVIRALPGGAYGSVRLVTDPDGEVSDVVVDGVDLSLGRWAEVDAGTAVADAVLACEIDRLR